MTSFPYLTTNMQTNPEYYILKTVSTFSLFMENNKTRTCEDVKLTCNGTWLHAAHM